jgi:hypothetical protein
MILMPTLETRRLLIRPFSMDDLQPMHRLLDVDLREAELGTVGAQTLPERAEWLQWTILNYTQLAKLYRTAIWRACLRTQTHAATHRSMRLRAVPDAFEQLAASPLPRVRPATGSLLRSLASSTPLHPPSEARATRPKLPRRWLTMLSNTSGSSASSRRLL